MKHNLYCFLLQLNGAKRIERVEARSRTSAFNTLFRLLNETGALFELDSVQLMENT
nr:MAG TPA: hypothetical protein [Caudoviricetes sp.]DAH95957.1 MAG TPA: hypothetical protein [Caudoviricetes sp.]